MVLAWALGGLLLRYRRTDERLTPEPFGYCERVSTEAAYRAVLWLAYHNFMAFKRTTVMVDEDDLAAVKAAAAREGRPEAELFREAFHLVALRSQTWDGDWDIPVVDFGRRITADDVDAAVHDALTDA